jgi:pimeloyl-ACP methyl ester carboxylesterase
LIEALQIEPPYMVANSLGGYQALWLAVLFPEAFRKLIVMHATGFPHTSRKSTILRESSKRSNDSMKIQISPACR